jgi:hypothetical protein
MKFRDWLTTPEGSALVSRLDIATAVQKSESACSKEGPFDNLPTEMEADWETAVAAFQEGLAVKLEAKHCKHGDMKAAIEQHAKRLRKVYFERFSDLHQSLNMPCVLEQARELGMLTTSALRLERGEYNNYPVKKPWEVLRMKHLEWAREAVGFWFFKKLNHDLDVPHETSIREFENGCVLC